MTPTYLLRIDVKKLAERLSNVERRRVSHGDAFLWLNERGFKTCRRGWYAASDTVGEIDDSCIIKAERLW